MSKPVLQIVIGSTRPGRVGLPVARWLAERTRAHGVFEVEVVDLAEVNLPLLDEPHHPRLGRYTHDHTRRWSATVDRADAIVFVTPEYNHGVNAALKNAIDYLHAEWRHKPVSFASYGGTAAGTRAVQMLKQIVVALGMVPGQSAVAIPYVQRFVTDGVFHADEALETAATATLDELAELTDALRPLRGRGEKAA